MGWSVDDQGLGVIFDRSIPAFAPTNWPLPSPRCARRWGIGPSTAWFAIPAAPRSSPRLRRRWICPPNSLDHEREVLRVAGNMSAPTVLFVLERVLAAGTRGRLMMAALGPGFTLSMLPLDA